jgi:hypothetical protein
MENYLLLTYDNMHVAGKTVLIHIDELSEIAIKKLKVTTEPMEHYFDNIFYVKGNMILIKFIESEVRQKILEELENSKSDFYTFRTLDPFKSKEEINEFVQTAERKTRNDYLISGFYFI